jgi:hypothetical protein
MKSLSLILVGTAVCVSSLALSAESRDGRWWLKLSALEKAIYTSGMRDGVNVGEGISPDPELFTSRAAELLAKKNTKQLVDGIDHFYSDFRNRSIPTYAALWMVAMEINGVDARKIEDMKIRLRREAASRGDD